MPTVELHQAFLWICDECGAEHFERGITVAPEEFDEEMAEAVRHYVEENDFDGAVYVRGPSEVECASCGATFRTEEA